MIEAFEHTVCNTLRHLNGIRRWLTKKFCHARYLKSKVTLALNGFECKYLLSYAFYCSLVKVIRTIASFFLLEIFVCASKCWQNSTSVIILCWFGRLGRAGSNLQYRVNSSQSISSRILDLNFKKTSFLTFFLRSFPKKWFISPE